MPPTRTATPAIWTLAILAAALLLCAVALVNGGPIYFPDTNAYLVDADRLAHFQAPWTVRPVFYGVAIWPFHYHGNFSLAIFVQGLVVAHIIYLTVRTCRTGLGPPGYLALVAGLVLLTSVSWHVSHLMPDIFMAVLVLALFLLGFCNDRLGRWEASYLILLAAASASFHLSSLPLGATILVLAVLGSFATRRRRVSALLVFTPMMLAVFLLLGFSFAVFGRLSFTPKGPPFLLARVLADGPGRAYLQQVCPGAGFTLCRYQDQLTDREEDFLWHFLPVIPPRDGAAIKAQAWAVMQGTAETFPVDVLSHALQNAFHQLVSFHSQTDVDQAHWDELQGWDHDLAHGLAHTRQADRFWDGDGMVLVNRLHDAVVVGSLVAVVVLLPGAVRAYRIRPAALIIVVLTSLVVNAVASGVLSGVFDRYQSRLIWLLPLTAVVAVLRARRPA